MGMVPSRPAEDPLEQLVRRVPRHIWLSLGLTAAMLLFSWFFFLPPARVGIEEDPEWISETLEGRVVAVLTGDASPTGEDGSPIRQILVQITKGSQWGRQVEILDEEMTPVAGTSRVRPGDRVLVEYSKGPIGERFYISDFVRLPILLLFSALFAVITVIVGQAVGLRSLISIGISVSAIAGFIIPGIISGYAPLAICIMGSILLMAATLYLIYQWNWKTHAALLGLTISLILTGLLAVAFANLTRLTGMGTEEAVFLTQFEGVWIDLRGLLLGGILLGAVGVLDDVAVGQASATFELKRANAELGWRQLFQHSMVIGRDHIASMVNTLLLAYVGASLPLFLLIALQNPSLTQTLSREFVVEEVVRTLVGSLGLILAVPITSLIASLVAHKQSEIAQAAGT